MQGVPSYVNSDEWVTLLALRLEFTSAIFVIAILCTVVALVIGLYIYGNHSVRNGGDHFAEKAIDNALKNHASDAFNPCSAVLLRQWNESTRSGIQTHRIYRTVENQYFLFICTSWQPGYLTHISRERAMHALRSTPQAFQQEFPGER